MIAKKAVSTENRRRKRQHNQGVSLRYCITLLLATLAAVGVHMGFYYAAPLVISWTVLTSSPEMEDEEEIFRVVTLPIEEESEINLPVPPEIIEPVPLEPEEMEIDILDAEYEELTLAPGDTNLPLPEIGNAPEESLEIEMSDSINAQLFEQAQEATTSHLDLVEPTPLNDNPIAVAAQGFLNDEDTSDLLEGELLENVENSNALPSDTRSLSDLLKVKQLGSTSGVARLGADVLFAFGDDKLRNSARITLIQLAALIRKNPKTRFIIEGHTDSFGSKSYNESLSLRRAAAVRTWLSKNRIPLSRVYLRACGDSRPLAEHDGSRSQQALNRRVEIHMRSATERLPEGCIDASVEVKDDED